MKCFAPCVFFLFVLYPILTHPNSIRKRIFFDYISCSGYTSSPSQNPHLTTCCHSRDNKTRTTVQTATSVKNFLISPDGNTKTMIGREPWYENSTQTEPSGYALSMLKMVGSDTDNDGVNETWTCAPGYMCTQDAPSSTNPATDPDADDLRDVSLSSGIYYDFVPMSSRNISITDLRFSIGPLEDPNKAYNEFPEQTQSRLAVDMIAETLDPRAAIITRKQRSKTVHMEVNTEFEGEINSYAP